MPPPEPRLPHKFLDASGHPPQVPFLNCGFIPPGPEVALMLATPETQAILPSPNMPAESDEVEWAHCPLCLTAAPLAVPFCPACGVAFEEDLVTCAVCSTPVGPEARVCPACSNVLA
ncbi:MAG: zinc ribbon domain-containing protein [Euryarchaeota archaeon]|nr:zinc ribbon domain-containing protein [Euryarchaeota archaeon]MDE1837986.1 zinc ribbon domain-containing protein [Euryarchaeota archaeon]MDE2046424.1 zinc ribbon domain-containing protein [Thermoplasmata archaeon]